MQVFEPTVQLVFPPDTLDSIAVLSSWHVEPELCEWKKVVLLAKKKLPLHIWKRNLDWIKFYIKIEWWSQLSSHIKLFLFSFVFFFPTSHTVDWIVFRIQSNLEMSSSWPDQPKTNTEYIKLLNIQPFLFHFLCKLEKINSFHLKKISRTSRRKAKHQI